jgi:hypothetical protein
LKGESIFIVSKPRFVLKIPIHELPMGFPSPVEILRLVLLVACLGNGSESLSEGYGQKSAITDGHISFPPSDGQTGHISGASIGIDAVVLTGDYTPAFDWDGATAHDSIQVASLKGDSAAPKGGISANLMSHPPS